MGRSGLQVSRHDPVQVPVWSRKVPLRGYPVEHHYGQRVAHMLFSFCRCRISSRRRWRPGRVMLSDVDHDVSGRPRAAGEDVARGRRVERVGVVGDAP